MKLNVKDVLLVICMICFIVSCQKMADAKDEETKITRCVRTNKYVLPISEKLAKWTERARDVFLSSSVLQSTARELLDMLEYAALIKAGKPVIPNTIWVKRYADTFSGETFIGECIDALGKNYGASIEERGQIYFEFITKFLAEYGRNWLDRQVPVVALADKRD